MELQNIKDPSFLKELDEKELEELAKDVRQFLLEHVSKTGGHLSSNLGVVELTIALHRVFDFQNDKILFDVGHQSYTHKILTGRAKDFDSLRKFHGLSGFQKRKESSYDVFEAGHSSTSLSAALGMAVARDLKQENYEVVPVIGDSALMSGMSLEALNNIGYEKHKVIIVFNDNNMSINHNVGAIAMSFSNLRNSKQYNDLKDDVKGFLNGKKHGKSIIHAISSFKDSIKHQVVDSGIFKEFNLEYHGPVDGHNIKELIRAFEVARDNEESCVIHVVTKKGKGYPLAEEDHAGHWHGVGAFDLETGKALTSVPENYKTNSAVVADYLEKLMYQNEKIVAITPAMMSGAKLENVFAHFPNRSFDVGIAEEHAVTFAAGLALNGLRPFVSIYSSFMQRAYDQINHDVCRMDLPVVFGVDRAGLVGDDGETHHGVFDIGFLRPMPNMILAQGKNAKETEDLLYTAFCQNHPFALRYARETVAYTPSDEHSVIPVGSWEYIIHPNEETRCIILTYGSDVLELKEMLEQNNLPYALVNARFFKPIDEHTLEEIVARKKPVYVYESDMKIGGLSDAVAAHLASKGLELPLTAIGLPDAFVQQGTTKQLKEELGIDLISFLKRVEKECHD